jgi:hypothetical protein
MQLGGQNELHIVATKLNKLMIIFYMNIIFQKKFKYVILK